MKLKNIKYWIVFFILLGSFHSCVSQKKNSSSSTLPHSSSSSQDNDQKENEKHLAQQKINQEIEKEINASIQESSDFKQINEKPVEKKLVVHLPQIEREFRAAWIASVANINWPSKRNMTTAEQKNEALQILDQLQQNNFNAVILQVRPSADALYASNYEPWSIFLTGETGKAPDPYYDPLEFWIEEAHKRGLELHAWLNPYRAHHSNGGRVNAASLVNRMQNDVVRLKNGMHWFDPSKQSTQNHASKVVMDIVKRYDVDGIHFDDYFYPYASYNNGADFPDHVSWQNYLNNGGKLSRADWRRENVNLFIKRIYEEIKAEKDWVKFGISPFGIWKSGVPYGVTGLSQFDELYADAKLWLNNGWIDYFTPQLYWPVDAPRQNFSDLLRWWESENTHKRHLWPGLNTVEIKVQDKPKEIIRQIELTRQLVPSSAGVAHWSLAGLNPQMLNSLKSGPYKNKALVPKSPWLKPISNEKPSLSFKRQHNSIEVNWHCNCQKQSTVKHWLLYVQYDNEWITEIIEGEVHSKKISEFHQGKKIKTIAVQAVDRLGNESEYEAISII